MGSITASNQETVGNQSKIILISIYKIVKMSNRDGFAMCYFVVSAKNKYNSW
jgi:hypothetical protein